MHIQGLITSPLTVYQTLPQLEVLIVWQWGGYLTVYLSIWDVWEPWVNQQHEQTHYDLIVCQMNCSEKVYGTEIISVQSTVGSYLKYCV